jgi:hypothetical protein
MAWMPHRASTAGGCCTSSPMLVFTALLLPLPAAAQAPARAAARPVADSAQAVVTACAVVQAIRPLVERGGCRVERYRETRTEYILRVREQAPPGAAPLHFAESEVRFSKTEPSVTVTRVPEL